MAADSVFRFHRGTPPWWPSCFFFFFSAEHLLYTVLWFLGSNFLYHLHLLELIINVKVRLYQRLLSKWAPESLPIHIILPLVVWHLLTIYLSYVWVKIKLLFMTLVKQEMYNLRNERQVELCYTPVYQLSPLKHRIIFQNIRSLHAHFDDVHCDANYKATDILAFVESRLTHFDDSKQYELTGFHAILRNDQKQSGNTIPPHGIALYVRDSYNASLCLHSSTSEFEYSVLKFSAPFKESLQVVVLYKSNACPINILKSQLNSLKTCINSSQPFIILGDFNIDVSWCQNASLLSEIEDIFKCKQLVKQSTTI